MKGISKKEELFSFIFAQKKKPRLRPTIMAFHSYEKLISKVKFERNKKRPASQLIIHAQLYFF